MPVEQFESPQPETLKSPRSFDVVFARHAAYQTGGEGMPEEAVGWLTPEGVKQSQQLGRWIFQEAIKSGKPTDILFISSPAAYEDKTGKLYGRRAEQTANEAMAQILELAQSLPDNQLRLLGPVPKKQPETPYTQRLVEPDIHYIASADNPRAYFEKQVEKFGTQPDESTGKIGRKEGYLRGDEEVDAVVEQIGAETAVDVATRTQSVVKDMKHLADVHQKHYPDRKFMVVLVTHDDVVRSFAQNIMGAGEQAHGYLPANTETLQLHIQGDSARMEFKGNVYNKPI